MSSTHLCTVLEKPRPSNRKVKGQEEAQSEHLPFICFTLSRSHSFCLPVHPLSDSKPSSWCIERITNLLSHHVVLSLEQGTEEDEGLKSSLKKTKANSSPSPMAEIERNPPNLMVLTFRSVVLTHPKVSRPMQSNHWRSKLYDIYTNTKY